MFFKSEPILKIQWDDNWRNEQKVVYYLQFKVEKIKLYGNRFLNSLRPVSVLSPPREGKNVLGIITQSDIEIKEKKVCLELPRKFMDDISNGDLLNLSISDRGWCIDLEKVKQ